MATYGSCICVAKTLFAPLDRLKIISQTRHMAALTAGNERVSGSSMTNLSRIISEQGPAALWRGNMSNVYRNMVLITLQATVYDKIKHMYLPMSRTGYSDFSYYFRLFASASCLMGLTCILTYPLDLINTRLASDMSKKGT